MKKKILALSLILTLAVTALTGCNQNENIQTSQITTKAATTEQTTTTTVWDEWEPDEWDIESEPQREIKTSAETREELIAIYLKAFSEKDTEVLSAFGGGSYDSNFNKLCKALDEAGNLPENVDEIDLDPKLYEVYYRASRVFETWEVVYPLANGYFTFEFKFSDYDYANQAYSVKDINCRSLYSSLEAYHEHVGSGEPFPDGGTTVELLDISEYLD